MIHYYLAPIEVITLGSAPAVSSNRCIKSSANSVGKE